MTGAPLPPAGDSTEWNHDIMQVESVLQAFLERNIEVLLAFKELCFSLTTVSA